MASLRPPRFVLFGALVVGGIFILVSQVLDDRRSNNTATTIDPEAGFIKDPSTIDALGYNPVDWWSTASDTVQSRDLLETNWVLIFDDSGSMDGDQCTNGLTKLETAKEAAVGFIREIPTEDNVAVYLLNDQTQGKLPEFGTRQDTLRTIVQAQAGGGTPLGAALRTGRGLMEQRAAKQLGYGTYNVVVLTDGEAGDAELMVEQTVALFEKTPIELYVIGFCLSDQHALNIPGLVRYYNARSPDVLSEAFSSILAESGAFEDGAITSFDKGS